MVLTHTVYAILIVVFVAILTWMFLYNRRIKARQRQLLGKDPAYNSSSSIGPATELDDRESKKQ